MLGQCEFVCRNLGVHPVVVGLAILSILTIVLPCSDTVAQTEPPSEDSSVVKPAGREQGSPQSANPKTTNQSASTGVAPEAVQSAHMIAIPNSADTPVAPEVLDPFSVPVHTGKNAQDAASYFARGHRLLRLSQQAEAVILLRTAIALDPTRIRPHEDLKQAALSAGRRDVASQYMATLVRLYQSAHNGTMAHQRYLDLVALNPKHSALPGLKKLLGMVAKKADPATTIMDRLRSVFGIFVFVGILFLMSNNRRKVSLRVVFWGLLLQLVFGGIILLTPVGSVVFQGAQDAVKTVLSYTDHAQKFLFGPIYGTLGGATGPAQYVDGMSGDLVSFGVTFVFHILPTIIFFGALMSVLYHLGLIQLVVRVVAWSMQRVMGTSGAESLSAAGNIFVGQTEAPLLVRPYVDKMTMSELMAVMCGGFATVAGGVLAAYVRFGINAGHLLAASVMSAPAALVAAKILYPETEVPETAGGANHKIPKTTTNIVDAAAAGATDGLKLALNVGAMLLAFMALIAMVDGALGYLSGLVGYGGLSLNQIFGTLLTPLAWCMGVSIPDLSAFGSLLGTKIAINEFVAYVQLGALQNQVTERSYIIATYALCGFANFSSIGIQIGGISGIAPGRRSDLARIGLKAMIGGAFASWMTACVAGIFL